MTPSGKVIWAATYIPPRDMGRTPGMLTILKAVLEACREERGDIPKFAEELRREVETWHSPAPGELERGPVGALDGASLQLRRGIRRLWRRAQVSAYHTA